MKLQFKHQKFQADAAKAVVDIFAGQPYLTPTYMMDRGYGQQTLTDDTDFTGWRNERIVPELSDKLILEHLQKVQRTNQIKPSDKLEGRYNLTIEMETGVGKTYTYITTMYELNKHYGWSKFIVVVPSIAIREGVYKSFQVTQDHFAEEYGKKIRFFIYNSAQLTEIDRFASDSAINVMIINVQAFNKSVDANEKLESGKRADKNAAIIFRKLDNFRSRRPIDIIAKTNPILIIDEPQSVEGPAAKKNLKLFSPLLTLRYSATHKSDSIYNMVYASMRWKRTTSGWSRRSPSRASRSLAIRRPMALSIWKASTFPKQTPQQPFSLTSRVRPVYARKMRQSVWVTTSMIIPAVWMSTRSALWSRLSTDATTLWSS